MNDKPLPHIRRRLLTEKQNMAQMELNLGSDRGVQVVLDALTPQATERLRRLLAQPPKKAETRDSVSHDPQDQLNLKQHENKDEFPTHNPAQPPNKVK